MTNPTEIRNTLHLRERAEERATRGGRRLMCIGRVTSEGVVVWTTEDGETVFIRKPGVEA